jgi:hypothetical protein
MMILPNQQRECFSQTQNDIITVVRMKRAQRVSDCVIGAVFNHK